MTTEQRIIIASDTAISIRSAASISEALETCLGSQGLILTEHDLGPEFFDLHTGIAGELFQKFINYRVRLAIVLPDPDTYGDRFSELAREHSSHGIVRFLRSLNEATEWLSE